MNVKWAKQNKRSITKLRYGKNDQIEERDCDVLYNLQYCDIKRWSDVDMIGRHFKG